MDTERSIFGGGARAPSEAASALTKLQTVPTALIAPDAAEVRPDEALPP